MNLKKLAYVLVILSICLPVTAAGNFSLSLQGGLQFPEDAGFKELYGSNQFLAGMKAQFHLTDSLYGWAGAWRQKASGTTPILEADAESCQRCLGVGAGWTGAFSDDSSLKYYGEIGILFFHYTEEALGIEVSGNATGFRLAAGARYHFASTWFAGAGAAYGTASKDIQTDTLETIKIKMGGFSLFLEVGARF